MRAVIVLGDSLMKSVIAEGIESEPQMEQLRPTGCRVSQISHRSRPCAPELIKKMLDGMVAQAFATWARKIFEEPLGLH